MAKIGIISSNPEDKPDSYFITATRPASVSQQYIVVAGCQYSSCMIARSNRIWHRQREEVLGVSAVDCPHASSSSSALASCRSAVSKPSVNQP
jgi:hypothetical protein